MIIVHISFQASQKLINYLQFKYIYVIVEFSTIMVLYIYLLFEFDNSLNVLIKSGYFNREVLFSCYLMSLAPLWLNSIPKKLNILALGLLKFLQLVLSGCSSNFSLLSICLQIFTAFLSLCLVLARIIQSSAQRRYLISIAYQI